LKILVTPKVAPNHIGLSREYAGLYGMENTDKALFHVELRTFWDVVGG